MCVGYMQICHFIWGCKHLILVSQRGPGTNRHGQWGVAIPFKQYYWESHSIHPITKHIIFCLNCSGTNVYNPGVLSLKRSQAQVTILKIFWQFCHLLQTSLFLLSSQHNVVPVLEMVFTGSFFNNNLCLEFFLTSYLQVWKTISMVKNFLRI